MNSEELEAVIKKIMMQGDPAYTTPSGAFLEHLRTLAQSQNLVGYAEACKLYTRIVPESINFIAASTPGILCNNYFTELSKFDYQKFIPWSLANAHWGDALKDSFSSPVALESAAYNIRIAVSEQT